MNILESQVDPNYKSLGNKKTLKRRKPGKTTIGYEMGGAIRFLFLVLSITLWTADKEYEDRTGKGLWLNRSRTGNVVQCKRVDQDRTENMIRNKIVVICDPITRRETNVRGSGDRQRFASDKVREKSTSCTWNNAYINDTSWSQPCTTKAIIVNATTKRKIKANPQSCTIFRNISTVNKLSLWESFEQMKIFCHKYGQKFDLNSFQSVTVGTDFARVTT